MTAPSLLSLLMKPREAAAEAAPAAEAPTEALAAPSTSPANLMHQFGRRKSACEMREAGASPLSYVYGRLSARCMPATGAEEGASAAYPILPRADFDEFGDHGDFALGDEARCSPTSFPSFSYLSRSFPRPVGDRDQIFPLGDVPDAPLPAAA